MNEVSPKNILSVARPDLVKEWDYEKNGDLLPNLISISSHCSVWWMCKKGHGWHTSPNHRTRKNSASGCPCCNNHPRMVSDENCLATINPKLAKEWHPTKNKLTPHDVTLYSNKMAWWICPLCNNEYETRIDSRQISGCPKCVGILNKNSKKESFAQRHPHLINEWHPTKNGKITPHIIASNSHRKIHWICKKGHEWVMTPHDRTDKKSNCPFCSGKRVCKDNCLATLNPELIQEWHKTKNGKLTPYDVTRCSGKKVWWKCVRCENEFEAFIANRSRGHGCECYRCAVLKDGTVCDSMVEAFFYLKYKKDGTRFVHHGTYGKKLGKHKFDFYLVDSNTYVEVTSFHTGSYKLKKYFATINKKKNYVENILGAKFKFIQYVLTKKEYKVVKDNMKNLSKD